MSDDKREAEVAAAMAHLEAWLVNNQMTETPYDIAEDL